MQLVKIPPKHQHLSVVLFCETIYHTQFIFFKLIFVSVMIMQCPFHHVSPHLDPLCGQLPYLLRNQQWLLVSDDSVH